MAIKTEKIRFALLGLGGVGGIVATELAAHPRGEIAVVCDLKKDLADQIMEQCGFRADHTADWQEAVARTDVDAVLIQTPNHLHEGPFIAALESGKHVSIQKPFALTENEVARMVAVAAMHPGQVTYVAQCYRMERCYQSVKEIIDSGRIGDIRHIKIDYVTGYMHYWLAEMAAGADKRWRLSPDSRGMLDGGVHAFDMVRFLTGQEAVRVYAQESAALMADYPHSSMVSAAFTLGNGTTAIVNSTFGAVSPWRPAMALEIYGTKGTIRDGKLIYHDSQNGWKKQPDYSDFYAEKEILGWPSELVGTGHPFGLEIDHFIDCIEGKSASLTPAWSGAQSALGVIKAMESVSQGMPLAIPEPHSAGGDRS